VRAAIDFDGFDLFGRDSMTRSEAQEKVLLLLGERGRQVDGGLSLVEERTIAKPYGWVFFYDSRRHLETGSIFDAIGGNGPLVVLAETGEVVTLGTAKRPEDEIDEFERKRRLR
jgi:hypothetical protein